MTTNYLTADAIKTVGVIGAGTMGAGIAQVAAQAGHPVILVDMNAEALERGIAGIRKALSRLAEKGKITAAAADEIGNRINPAQELSALADTQLVVEAIVEKLEVKQSVFAELETICSDTTILASNTSSISITSIASALKHPERFAGLHFFNPAPVMKLVEVIHGLATAGPVIDTLLELTKGWGKVAVAAKSSPGFIVNRVARPFYAEGMRLVEEGVAEPALVDALMRQSGGFRMGPFELTDLIGQDVNYAVTCSVFASYYNDPRFKPSLVQKELVDAGWLGRKSGRGFYRYEEGKQQAEEPEWDEIRFGGFFQIREVVNSPAIGALVTRIQDSGVVIPQLSEGETGEIRFANGARLMLTNGQTTLERSQAMNDPFLIQMDLAQDYTSCTALAISARPELPEEVWTEVYALLDFLGIKSIRVKDMPGLVVMRTVAMLINEACDALHLGIASAQGIDDAMQAGLNYPQGLFAWADQLRPAYVAEVLENTARFYADDRYRLSPALRVQSRLGQSFYAAQGEL
ncbi:3-hydroxyacyl-CoA dehydrogenase [Marinobacterium mangrovicola]|uniref:3-hydroxyacyl-CoA dehydrogenase n=1 Tax=Marinobacterium mangrovicola TaxID=1476959 RepID=A0A4R1GIP8_9GAMM|nr:3-hydroxyacyl-CoA dehydrogenase [Marinobacterium mangrovicola]TCK06980.1 3-hydroxyacyl-CoA dehydrogenase [Marinobacterium mangrovicola]